MSVEIDTHGPVFDGRAAAAFHAAAQRISDTVAEHGRNEILSRFGSVLRSHPTGRLEAGVTVNSGNPAHITDGGVVYGPWIEGVGSRNSPRTRFPGYHTYRLIRQRLDAEATKLAEPDIAIAVREANSG